MDRTDDKQLLAWMDKLDPKQLQGLEGIAPSAEESVDEAALQRIKRRTFAQLGLELGEEAIASQPKTYTKALRRRWLAAACAAVILGSALVSFSPDVRARLKEALQFIPGFGVVQQIENAEQTAYVLSKPLEFTGENGTVTIEGMLIQGTGGQIVLSGNKIAAAAIKSLALVTGQGQLEFKQSYSTWGSGGPWQAAYYYTGNIAYEGLETVSVQFGNTTIDELHLTRAKTADDLAGFGSSDIQNGIRITGIVTPLDGSSRKVNLLAQLTGKQKVDSYGKQPIAEGLQLQLMDKEGHAMPIKPDSGFIKPYELLFDDPAGADGYTLVIPAIRMIDYGAKHVKVTLPVPEAGEKAINVSSQIAGFPIHFTQVERLNDESLRVEVDTHFDPNQPQTLQSYRIFTKYGIGMSYSTQMNEQTWAVETEWLTVKPGQKSITFYIGDPQIVVKGTWILNDLH
ncbi:MAG: hypothetical protein K0Q59_310 [Paenibacillus sp.]|jgi:hypothetical protein|nr:hypothetical protein [Paenibacillus sp.]